MIDNKDNKNNRNMIAQDATHDTGTTKVDTLDDGGTTVLPYKAPELRPLTRKETAYIKYLNDNPTASKRQAVKAVYDIAPTASTNTADKMIAKIEKRPSVLAILNAHASRAEELLQELTETSMEYARGGGKDGASYAGVAEKALNSVLDRVHGKATQTVDMNVQAVNLNIDLTQ